LKVEQRQQQTNKQTTHQRKQHEKRVGRKTFSGEIFSLSAMQFATPTSCLSPFWLTGNASVSVSLAAQFR